MSYMEEVKDEGEMYAARCLIGFSRLSFNIHTVLRRPSPAGESVHVNEAGDVFYKAPRMSGLEVEVGAAVKLEMDSADPDGERFGVALLCAIWTSSSQTDNKEEEEGDEEEEELLIEVNWFSKPKETRLSKKKM